MFAGSPEFAKLVLENLACTKYKPSLVITQPDRRKGRGKKLLENQVKRLSQKLEISLIQPESLKDEIVIRHIKSFKAQVLIVAAYGQILPETLLELPQFGCINVHASILPRWRGAAPIERAIMAGDSYTGISIMQMEKGLDTGPILYEGRVDQIQQMSALELEERLALIGSEKLMRTLKVLELNYLDRGPKPSAQSQDGSKATYAKKILSEDRDPKWSNTCISIYNQVRALADRMPVTFSVGNLEFKIMKAIALEQMQNKTTPSQITRLDKTGIYVQCGQGTLQITRIKLNRGQGQAMDIGSFLNGGNPALAVGQNLIVNENDR